MSQGLWLTVLIAAVVVSGVFWTRSQAHAQDLINGDVVIGAPAPGFTLPDAQSQQRRLEEFRGNWLLLYFYPKDDTPGCTKEACAFRDGYRELRRRGVQVVGVSVDDNVSHQRFAKKYQLPFPLLSDADGQVAKRYGAYWSLGPLGFAKRHSFLIDAQGRVALIYRSVDPDKHYRQVLDDLERLITNTTD